MHRESIVKQIEGKLTSGVDAGNDTFILMAASVYYHEQVSGWGGGDCPLIFPLSS